MVLLPAALIDMHGGEYSHSMSLINNCSLVVTHTSKRVVPRKSTRSASLINHTDPFFTSRSKRLPNTTTP